MSYQVRVTAKLGEHEVEEKAYGNTAATAYSAGQAVARDFQRDGYTVNVGKVTKVTA